MPLWGGQYGSQIGAKLWEVVFTDHRINTLINGLCKAGRISESLSLRASVVACTTLIEGLRNSGKLDKAYGVMQKMVEWFKKMLEFRYSPDDVTYSIDAYDRLGNVEMVLALYDRARKGKLHLDPTTFATMFGFYGASGNFNGALTMFEEMKALGVK
ncbi:hypothetical protein M5K25_006338 [Dendrobium thyrsiflorum]|uniref:Pentatricopeptide repeat-containing protein n=1 Tax=Dendrobium thyrsiflorum TaxID=117978 RepID=A0ABD0VBB1_DENTH